MSFQITRDALEAMLKCFAEELPREGCGFLAGKRGIASRFYQINNTNPNVRRFLMDPLHVRRTEASIRERGQTILAIAHSHPEGECYPSKWDLEAGFYDEEMQLPLWEEQLQLIVLLRSDEISTPLVRAFRYLTGGEIEEVGIERV